MSNWINDAEFVREKLSEASLYEQLAEECVELAHACLKKARLLRGENPTPLTINDVDGMIREEYTDVCVVSDLLHFGTDVDIYESKIHRWADRLS